MSSSVSMGAVSMLVCSVEFSVSAVSAAFRGFRGFSSSDPFGRPLFRRGSVWLAILAAGAIDSIIPSVAVNASDVSFTTWLRWRMRQTSFSPPPVDWSIGFGKCSGHVTSNVLSCFRRSSSGFPPRNVGNTGSSNRRSAKRAVKRSPVSGSR
ncbi:hypothetical protein DFS34DRAFT_319233 [Phlyctochytrium arcticum]|nr:hypothetical protein DFS34DRAFT_319233 [Phlyctochytrium arcticum]